MQYIKQLMECNIQFTKMFQPIDDNILHIVNKEILVFIEKLKTDLSQYRIEYNEDDFPFEVSIKNQSLFVDLLFNNEVLSKIEKFYDNYKDLW